MRKIKNKKGSTIIELLISLVIVGLVVTAVATSATYSIKNTGEAKNRQFATSLAQQVVEKSRVEKNSMGFPNFKNAVGANTYCFDTIPSDFTPASLATLTLNGCNVGEVVAAGGIDFTRYATFSPLDTDSPPDLEIDTIEIEVFVEWTESGDTRSVQVTNQLVKPSLSH